MKKEVKTHNFEQSEQNIKLVAFDVLRLFSVQLPTFRSVVSIYESLVTYLVSYFPIQEVVLFERKDNRFQELKMNGIERKNFELFSLEEVNNVAKSHNFLIKKLKKNASNKEQDILYIPVSIEKETNLVITLLSKENSALNNHFAEAISLIGNTASVYAYKKSKTIRLEKERDVLNFDLKKQHEQLHLITEALTEQSSQIRKQQNKKQELTQEIHHRVNNNLQIISSLINLYASNNLVNSDLALKEIQNRVQTMAVIHQNIHKSNDLDVLSVSEFILALVTHFKGYFSPLTVVFNVNSKVEPLSLDTLVPLGLLINEIINILVEKTHSPKKDSIVIDIRLSGEDNAYKICFNTDGNTAGIKQLTLEDDSSINSILASALIEQLEGSYKIQVENNNECAIHISFSNI
ncbi:MAG: sensor histidine kinase [Lishizhenia sp.]